MAEIIVLIAAVITVASYVCRLAMLRIGENRTSAIVLHVSLALSAGWVGYHAWMCDLNFGDIMSLMGAASWIVISLPTWRGGVPTHFQNTPVALDHIDLNAVSGGKRQ